MVLHLITSFCYFLMVGVTAQQMLGAGKWTILSVKQCENAADMPWALNVRRHKLNRTHEAFDAELSSLADFDETFSARADVCKMLDGGCKPFQSVYQESAVEALRTYAVNNTRAVLTAAGVDPPDFPVPKGDYRVENYVINVDEYSKKGLYGEWHGVGYVVKDGQDLACLQASVKYEPVDDFGSLYG